MSTLFFDPYGDSYAFRSGSMEREELDIKQVNTPLHVYIDGPFGAPTSQIFHAQHALLIGTGIGVTPFASILQSIMHRSVFIVLDFFLHCKTKYRNFKTNIPRKGISGYQSQFPHSCVCE
jgi:hypothetical protein